MTMPDRKFPWIWTGFLLAFAMLFAVLEGWAISTGGTTLSRYVFEVSKEWPLFPWVLGVLMGGLAVHFFWRWNPGDPNDHRG